MDRHLLALVEDFHHALGDPQLYRVAGSRDGERSKNLLESHMVIDVHFRGLPGGEFVGLLAQGRSSG